MDGTRRSRSAISRIQAQQVSNQTNHHHQGGGGKQGQRACARARCCTDEAEGRRLRNVPISVPDAKMLITSCGPGFSLPHARPGMEQSELNQGLGGRSRNRKDGYRKSLSPKRKSREVLRKRAQTVGERRHAGLFCDAWKEFSLPRPFQRGRERGCAWRWLVRFPWARARDMNLGYQEENQ